MYTCYYLVYSVPFGQLLCQFLESYEFQNRSVSFSDYLLNLKFRAGMGRVVVAPSE